MTDTRTIGGRAGVYCAAAEIADLKIELADLKQQRTAALREAYMKGWNDRHFQYVVRVQDAEAKSIRRYPGENEK